MHSTSYSACLNYIWQWSIHYGSLSAMFTPLHSSTNKELFKTCICNQSSQYEKYDGATCPSCRLKLKYPLPFSVSYVRLVTQHYKLRTVWKALNQGSHYENYGWFLVIQRKPSCATTKLMFFTVSKDEWNTKEDTGKSLKNALDILWYTKRHLSGWSDVEQWKNQVGSLGCYRVMLVWRYQAVS